MGLRSSLQPVRGRTGSSRNRVHRPRACTGSGRKCTSKRSCAPTRRRGSSCLVPVHRSTFSSATARIVEIDKRTIKMTDWSSAEWTMTLPNDGALGDYSIVATTREPKPPANEDERQREQWDPVVAQQRIYGSFLVAAYRRPDFRVDATLGAGSALAGDDARRGHYRAVPVWRSNGRPPGRVEVVSIADLHRSSGGFGPVARQSLLVPRVLHADGRRGDRRRHAGRSTKRESSRSR